MAVQWEWPPPGFGADGYVDNIDVIFAIIVNSIVMKIDSLSLGGASAYQVYLDNTSDEPPMTVAQWLDSLRGADGADGADGVDGAQGPAGPGVVVLTSGQAVPSGLPADTLIFRLP